MDDRTPITNPDNTPISKILVDKNKSYCVRDEVGLITVIYWHKTYDKWYFFDDQDEDELALDWSLWTTVTQEEFREFMLERL